MKSRPRLADLDVGEPWTLLLIVRRYVDEWIVRSGALGAISRRNVAVHLAAVAR
ncbi:hypothetical protein Pd630_LPD16130 (plasmid) [Rhodococcus opacus PD630]|nr:hypothetical protein Pd630_LPD16130 [Rhodococcus opacus PD630]